MRIVMLLAIAAIVFAAMLYHVLRERVLDVTQADPFRALIGTQLTLTRPMQVVQERSLDAVEGLPSLWEQERMLGDGTRRLAMAPIGTPIRIERAQLRKGGVSGFTHAFVIGTLDLGGRPQRFCFPWGQQHVLYVERPYWTFEEPPWLAHSVVGTFYLPEP
jgi:hypothetical protein